MTMANPMFCQTTTSRTAQSAQLGSASHGRTRESRPTALRTELSGPFSWKMNFQM
jgi:hypothetical protein